MERVEVKREREGDGGEGEGSRFKFKAHWLILLRRGQNTQYPSKTLSEFFDPFQKTSCPVSQVPRRLRHLRRPCPSEHWPLDNKPSMMFGALRYVPHPEKPKPEMQNEQKSPLTLQHIIHQPHSLTPTPSLTAPYHPYPAGAKQNERDSRTAHGALPPNTRTMVPWWQGQISKLTDI
ncbi:hypothetical protein PAAG_08061 [Paracoccidioides lutzii Pb01]|uniref:Uncharacterized protein n=1 Tax=Paracoccidioides lutzii (strain ATCC MYA-826 / Pb01) TaxID=502779 RepID=C1HBC0_PARBA|nr:hypothetical protein PAAG_08061 [Paracoccidioides lutzii Pb01]EEH37643.2 hypothetical protein PAAG_08061 [Paracoccidioides lutzii Pb01]